MKLKLLTAALLASVALTACSLFESTSTSTTESTNTSGAITTNTVTTTALNTNALVVTEDIVQDASGIAQTLLIATGQTNDAVLASNLTSQVATSIARAANAHSTNK